MKESSFRDLVAWQKAMDLVDKIYDIVRSFPRYELFGLSAQMRSAAVSIPSNIAEGHGRFNLRDFRRFLRDARASYLELQTEIEVAARQRFISREDAASLTADCVRVAQLISGLIRHINKRLQDDHRRTTNDERPTTTDPSAP